MNHLGDITKISGYEAPIVDCVIGGSPCQNLSVAGNRKGLLGAESQLFHEQIRIVKEMRERDARDGRTNEHIRPRYMVWENVPGAFSSNKGEDFRVVLEEIAKVIDKDAVIPMPEKNKWHTSGCIVGDGWSIAWRVFDAQFWGVPQRRRRISLVADFGGESASEILFIRKSLSRDTDESRTERKGTSSNPQGSIGVYDSNGIAYTMQERAGCEGGGKGALIQTDKSASLRCGNWQTLFQPITYSKSKRAQTPTDYETWKESDKANTMNCFDQGDVRATDVVVAFDRSAYNQGKNAKFDIGIDESGIAHSLVAKGPGGVCYSTSHGCFHMNPSKNVANTLVSTDYKDSPTVCYAVDCRNGTESDKNGALQSNSAHSLNGNNVVRVRYIVRRLTPLECERLQGFPDGWTDIGEYINSKGKKCKTSDAARYKALGNSIALPSWRWVLKRISACYERTPTMASLFSGIGGFDLLWTQINGTGTVLWEAEIDDFPDAVTKVRLG
jgi:DNA (cytosine-5)-methyltransferase 1